MVTLLTLFILLLSNVTPFFCMPPRVQNRFKNVNVASAPRLLESNTTVKNQPRTSPLVGNSIRPTGLKQTQLGNYRSAIPTITATRSPIDLRASKDPSTVNATVSSLRELETAHEGLATSESSETGSGTESEEETVDTQFSNAELPKAGTEPGSTESSFKACLRYLRQVQYRSCPLLCKRLTPGNLDLVFLAARAEWGQFKRAANYLKYVSDVFASTYHIQKNTLWGTLVNTGLLNAVIGNDALALTRFPALFGLPDEPDKYLVLNDSQKSARLAVRYWQDHLRVNLPNCYVSLGYGIPPFSKPTPAKLGVDNSLSTSSEIDHVPLLSRLILARAVSSIVAHCGIKVTDSFVKTSYIDLFLEVLQLSSNVSENLNHQPASSVYDPLTRAYKPAKVPKCQRSEVIEARYSLLLRAVMSKLWNVQVREAYKQVLSSESQSVFLAKHRALVAYYQKQLNDTGIQESCGNYELHLSDFVPEIDLTNTTGALKALIGSHAMKKCEVYAKALIDKRLLPHGSDWWYQSVFDALNALKTLNIRPTDLSEVKEVCEWLRVKPAASGIQHTREKTLMRSVLKTCMYQLMITEDTNPMYPATCNEAQIISTFGPFKPGDYGVSTECIRLYQRLKGCQDGLIGNAFSSTYLDNLFYRLFSKQVEKIRQDARNRWSQYKCSASRFIYKRILKEAKELEKAAAWEIPDEQSAVMTAIEAKLSEQVTPKPPKPPQIRVVRRVRRSSRSVSNSSQSESY